ncbi:hypothetical protein HT102_08105 [Hoyosella sp. G463]|uniref:Histidine kinase/HSP90-like ATPase domain-containing protein n=1 Tax=Lolliginicoccus lacisalsi TaxID=2742202 RepID=A0A927JC19_9ACTN|nr:ATP-binding protein [Lolliginicoccus lacisalsi]MBD8506444.1 hypothetical protein [Lolliginicoccus lacisalsi]
MIARNTSSAQRGISVDISIRADIHYLPVFREVVKSVAQASGFDADGIDDVQLAVDEVAATLIEITADGSEVSCSLEDNGGELCVTMTSECAAAPLPRSNSFRWHVVRTLADDLDWHQDAVSEKHSLRNEKCPTTTVQIVKRKALPTCE